MPEFLTTRGVTSHIESIISNSKEVLFLISPYISFVPNSIIIRIQEALERGVNVTLIYRYKEKIHLNEIAKLEVLKGIKLFYNHDLHAKAYFNETEAVVTSFNLSGSSESNNYEFGIYFSKSDSQDMFEKLKYESNLILKQSIASSIFSNNDKISSQSMVRGYCIRCKVGIDSDPEKPFCFSCYTVWKEFGNYNYVEKYCHLCGESTSTSMANPTCDNHDSKRNY